MARRSRSRRLNVFLNARLVGHLEQAASGAISFNYASDWLAWENAMPASISLPLSDQTWRGYDVVNVFENLLPDADRVRRNVAERLGAEGVDAFSLLAATGRDCVGALQFLGEDDMPGSAGEVRVTLSARRRSPTLFGAFASTRSDSIETTRISAFQSLARRTRQRS